MAWRGCLCVVLLLFLSHQPIRTQSETADPETLTQYEVSNQNEAADDKLCLARNAIVTARKLAERFQDDAVLSEKDFRLLLTNIQEGLQVYGTTDFSKNCAKPANAALKVNGGNTTCSEMLIECPSLDEIYARHSQKSGGLNYSSLAEALQDAAFSVTNPKCHVSHDLHKRSKPLVGQAWGYGFGFVTTVCIISNIGAVLTPFMTKTFFQRLLQFLVAMGAGTLVATGLLVLLPEAFDIVSIEHLSEDYVWKSATALFSIYVFFVSERFLKFLLKSREIKSMKRNESLHIEAPTPSSGDPTSNNAANEKDPITTPLDINNDPSDLAPDEHGHSHFLSPPSAEERRRGRSRGRRGPVATVAWMVMIGDVLHNFVDGMAIGAAFTENIFLGVSIGIAVICEELPHELADVAILLHSGLGMKKALLLNFLSACVCYIGLVVGIVLGENTEANRWILAIAGGLFLYVPLVDMLPDMSQHLEAKMREDQKSENGNKVISRETWVILTCQSVGLLIGMCIIVTVVNLSAMIDLDS